MGQWTLEQLKNLVELEVEPVAGFSICLIPIRKGQREVGYGSRVVWEARGFQKGSMGPLNPYDPLVYQAVGLSEVEAKEWVGKVQKAVGTLNKLYPALVPGMEEKVKAIEASVPAGLPEAESEG